MKACLFILMAAACSLSVRAVDLDGSDLVVGERGEVAAEGYSNSSATTATLTFAFDDDCDAPAISGNIRFVKRGAGTVTFAAKQTYGGGTVVSNGFIGVSDACDVPGIGADGEIVLAGGGLSFEKRSARYDLNRKTTVASGCTGTLLLAGGQTIHPYISNVGFVKGTLALRTLPGATDAVTVYLNRGTKNDTYSGNGLARGGTMDVGRGIVLSLGAGDTFGGANHQEDITLIVRKGGKVSASTSHSPLTPNVVLEGGATITATDASRGNSKAVSVGDIVKTGTWKSYDLCRQLTVLPDPDGQGEAAVLGAQNAHLAPAAQEAVFDVQAGATLDVKVQLWPANGATGRSLRKTGGGTMKLYRPLEIGGPLSVEDGTVELAPHVTLGNVSELQVRSTAKLVFGDGSVLVKTPDLSADPGGFLSTAPVWFDATALSAADGATVTRTPNLGTAGGQFGPYAVQDVPRPTYDADGIGGKPALYFAGGKDGAGLELRAYTNHTDRLTYYLVMKWDGWTDGDGGANYRWHGPLSMMPNSATGEDYNTDGSADIQWNDTLASFNVVNGSTKSVGLTASAGLTADKPLLIRNVRSGMQAAAGCWWNVNEPDFATGSVSLVLPTNRIEIIGLGGRMTSNGSVARPNPSRMLKGWIGELIVFSRDLTDAETAYVETYLKRKWFGSTVEQAPEPKPETGSYDRTFEVTVGDGAAAFGFDRKVAKRPAAGVWRLAKKGEGTLAFAGAADSFDMVNVEAGALRLGGEAAVTAEASVWMDADDAAAVVTDADGRVVSIRNKGSAGGRFVANPRKECPCPTLTNLLGRTALKFDWHSAIGLDITNAWSATRQMYVYGVMRRDAYGAVNSGPYAGPFSFSIASDPNSDQSAASGLHFEEQADTVNHVSPGYYNSGSFTTAVRTGDAYLLSVYQQDSDIFCGFETPIDAQPGYSNVTSHVLLGNPSKAGIRYDYLLLGGRLWAGAPQTSPTNNRMWNGSIGEFIVFDHQLPQTQHDAVIGYLRKKWFGLGSGSATPPTLVTGVSAGSPATDLAVVGGATVEVAGPKLSVKALTLADGATLSRLDAVTDAAAFSLFDVTGLLSVAGSQTLRAAAFPSGEVRFLDAQDVTGTAAWSLAGAKSREANVAVRDDGLWLRRNGLIFIVR